ncbi:hypothetical protein BGX27_006894 [Mortierella sp. AM989]|nr:hypothetical protein BGX27_006894 [Mortierella sp. AM989]
MLGSSADPGPGPAPPPSLTLPPLRELDKAIRPDPHAASSSSDLYMSSSSAPSTTTTSSLSRADSLSSMEYLQGMHHLHHVHSHRQLSSVGGSSSTTTGSTTGSSYGYSIASGSGGSSTGGGNNFHHHHRHSAGLGRATLNAAAHQHHQQQHQRQSQDPASPSSIAGTQGTGSSSRATGEGATSNSSGRSGSTNGSAGAEQQGRNSTKRAAQNRAAQRAFRQRKDLYVRELERKAEQLQQAEGRIMQLAARNRELEAALAAQDARSSSSQPQQPQPQQQQPPHNGADAPAGSLSGVSREQDKEPTDHEREWSREERAPMERRGSHDAYEGHYPPRAVITRHASSHQLQHAYSNTSPLMRNGSLKHKSLSKHQPQYQQQHHQRPESDYEFDVNDNNPHSKLHRHPSESSLKTGRRESNSADSGEDYEISRPSHYTRSRSSESKSEYVQSTRSNQQNSSMVPEHSESLSPPSSDQQHPSNQQSATLNERPPLYPISTQGLRHGASNYSNPPSARSWSFQHEDGLKPHSPRTGAAPSPIAPGGMVAATSPVGGGYLDHPGARAEMEYISDERSSEPGNGYSSVRKKPSDGNISWTSSNASTGTGSGSHEINFTSSRGFPDHVHGEIRKQASCGSFSGTRSGLSLVNAIPASSPMAAASRDGNNDMEIQDSFHHHQPRQLHHRASTGSVSIRDSDRQNSGSGQRHMVMSDSPEIRPSDVRFGNPASGNTSPRISRQQHQYFFPMGQQQRQRGSPQSPGQEYTPGTYSSSPRSHLYQQHYRQGQGSNDHSPKRDSGEKYTRSGHPETGSSDMDTVYEQPRNVGSGISNGGYSNEASMGSP